MDLLVDATETARAAIGPLTKSFPESLLWFTLYIVYFAPGPIKHQIGFEKLWTHCIAYPASRRRAAERITALE